MPAPRVFWRGHVFVLLITTFFRQSTSYFLRLDKFEKNFCIVVKAATAAATSQ